ncbi:MAG: hypothetical protein Q8R17_01040 [bacterium]|nr:hypothetical protein [bacterium]TSC85193.1 MAG: hypothetical protein G01um101417_60 [Parcubacteria group bacterium Gr01-1014_17]
MFEQGHKGHLSIIPLLMLLFALVFLFDALGYISPDTTAVVWPVIVGVAAILKLVGGR